MKYKVGYIGGRNGSLIEEEFNSVIDAREFALQHMYTFLYIKCGDEVLYDFIEIGFDDEDSVVFKITI